MFLDLISEEEFQELIKFHSDSKHKFFSSMCSIILDKTMHINTEKYLEIEYGDKLGDSIGKLIASTLIAHLIKNNWNKAKTARKLGISRQTLLTYIKKYDIKNPLEPIPRNLPSGKDQKAIRL